MSQKESIIAMIPARIGSTRLKVKNLALLNGKPMIAYAISAASKSGVFDRIIINSDSTVFEKIAKRYRVEFYLRPEPLGSSATKSDDVVLDFIEKYQADIVAWVNPICPLQTSDEIRNVVKYFLNNELDSLITIENKQVHCVYNEEPVNFVKDGKFARTQDLKPVQPFVYSVMMWRTKPFIQSMRHKGFAFFTGKVGYYPVSRNSSIIVKTEQDLQLIQSVLSQSVSLTELQYDPAAIEALNKSLKNENRAG